MTSIIKVDQIQTAAGTNPIDQGRIMSKDDGYILKQATRFYDTATRNVSTTFVDGPIWTLSNVLPTSYLWMHVNIPVRQDDNGWAGLYFALWHSVDGGSTWRSMGTTGYDGNMTYGAYNIVNYTNAFLLNPTEIALSSQGDVTFKMRYRSYSGTTIINGSHDINGGGDSYQDANSTHFWNGLKVMEYAAL